MKDYHLWIIDVFGQAIKICHVLGRSRDFFLDNIRYVVVDIYRSFEPLWNISYPSYMKQLDTISGFIFIQQSHISSHLTMAQLLRHVPWCQPCRSNGQMLIRDMRSSIAGVLSRKLTLYKNKSDWWFEVYPFVHRFFFRLFASYLAAKHSYYGHFMYSCIILVGGLEHEFYFSINIGNVIIPTDFHIFQMGRYTTNQKS